MENRNVLYCFVFFFGVFVNQSRNDQKCILIYLFDELHSNAVWYCNYLLMVAEINKININAIHTRNFHQIGIKIVKFEFCRQINGFW